MYTVKFLSDQEFERLPYKHVKDALGCADKKTQTAYVRKTGIAPLDQFVTQHEIEELIAKVSPHEEDGIRYKRGGPIIRNIASAAAAFIPGVGPFLSAGMQLGHGLYEQSKGKQAPWQTALGTAGAFLGGNLLQGSQGFQAGVAGSKAAGGGLMGQTLSGAKGALGFGAAGGAANTASKVGSTAGSFADAGKYNLLTNNAQSFASKFGPALGAVGRMSSSIGPNSLGFAAGKTATTPAIANPSGLTGGLTGGGINTTAQAAGKGPSMLSQLMSSPMTKTALGAAVPLVGNAFAPSVKQFDPMQSQLFTDVLNRVKSGTVQPLTDEQRVAITAQYDKELSSAKENLLKYWKGVRPGSDITNDTELQKQMADLESTYGQNKANAVLQAQFGLSQTQTQMLSELAAMDVYSLAQQAQVSYGEAEQFKQMLAQLGMAVSGGDLLGSAGVM